MSLPNKLYINKFMIRPGMLYPAEFPPDNPEEEYIRKEALLEWAKEMLELIIGNGVYAKGKRDSYQELIKHIESL